MTFVVSGKLTIDASQGKSELSQLKAAKDAVSVSADKMSAKEAKAALEVRRLASQAEIAATKNRLLSETEVRVANEAVTMGRAHNLAAGQVGNLTAQFNDIGVMMAAGQNPFQLAIQQGTQITQVIGPMGAAGAAKALKAALVSMVSPLTLITIGSIAAGAALTNWLTGADEKVASLEDHIEAAGNSIEAFVAKAQKSRLSTAEMVEEFGKASPELRLILADMTALAKIDAQKGIDATAQSIRELALEADTLNEFSNMVGAQRFLGLGSVGRANREAGHQFAQNLLILDSTADAATRLSAALDIRDQLLDAAGGLDGLNTRQKEFYDGLLATIRDLELFAGALQAPWNELKATGSELWSSLTSNAETYLAKRIQIEGQARHQIEQLRLEAEIQQTIALHGEGSVEVAELRLQAERQVYQQQLESRGLSEALKQEMMEAWDAANGVASVDMAGNISLAADQAHRLMVNMMKANGQEIMGRVRANPDFNDPRGESRGAGNADYTYQDHDLPDVDMPSNPKSRRSRKGGGASAYDKERKALQRLIDRERERLEVLRETDPVLQEMVRIRDQLKGATDAEREAVEALIRERLEEEKAVAQTREATTFLEGVAGSAADALTKKGDEAAEAWKRVAAQLLEAALQAAILGEGPLMDFLGGGGGGKGKGFGSFILNVLGLADGGTVYGDGGNRDDKVPAFLSPGETVVHAKATRKYRPLLQAMNDGVEIPGLATGGEIGTSNRQGTVYGATPSAGPAHAVVRVLPSPLFKTMVEETSGDIVVQGLEKYDREVAPDTARRAIDDPHGAG